jgi:hypothetical protein
VRIGILADIHEHVENLDAALSRLRRLGAERLVVLGDVIDSGRRMVETTARLDAAGAVGVWGNHDIGFARPRDPAAISDIPAPVRAYLGRLADRFEIDGALFSHVEPWRDPYDVAESYYLDGPPTTAERARRTFEAIPQRIALIGHFHRWMALDADGPIAWDPAAPLRLRPDGRYLIGVHAVLDGWCALLDTAAGVLEAIPIGERTRRPARAPADPDRDGAGALLDRLRDHPGADDAGREALFDELVARFPAAAIGAALRGRLGEVGGAHGPILLRLVESLGVAALYDELAAALERGPAPPADRAWEALSLLDAAGVLDDHPELAEAHAELAELLEGDDATLAELAEQLEEPDGVALALEGLDGVEPDVRAAIVAGLEGQPARPGLVAFLRLLALGPDAATREAALGVLEGLDPSEPLVAAAWRHLEAEGLGSGPATGERPRMLEAEDAAPPVAPAGGAAVVGELDGDGRAALAFASRDGGGWSAAVFTCDVSAGVVAVAGLHAEEAADARAALEAIPGLSSEGNAGVVGLARELLAGSLLLGGGPGAPTALRYWVEHAVGAGLRPRPLPALGGDRPGTPEDLRRDAAAVLDARPGWRDGSPLARDLALELRQRAGADDGPPADDPAARRLLFDRRVRDRVPALQGMLLWQALVWQVGGEVPLAAAARRLAASLLGPEQLLPTHPFLESYLRRSLEGAGEVPAREGTAWSPRRLPGSG